MPTSQATSQLRITCKRVMPLDTWKTVIERNVNIGASLVIPAGTVLGPITTGVNDVQTLTIGGTPTGGTFPLSGVNPVSGKAYTITVNFNSTVAQTQVLLDAALGSRLVTVSGGTLPGATQIFTGVNGAIKTPIPVMTGSTTGLTGGSPTFAVVHTTPGITVRTYIPYLTGSSDGSQIATAILPIDVATDGAGNIFRGSNATGGASQWGESVPVTDVYTSGDFLTSQLVGVDTPLISVLGWQLLEGTITAGIIRKF